MSLSDEQKKEIIDIAKKTYDFTLSSIPSMRDDIAKDLKDLEDGCYYMTSIVHYIAKNRYNFADEDNKVYHCLVTFGEQPNQVQYSHFINCICNSYIDASIEQFNNYDCAVRQNITFSSYDNNEEFYKELEEKEPLSDESINRAIEAYLDVDSLIWFKSRLDEKYRVNTQVTCPKCGSTQIQAVTRKWSLLTGFLTDKVDRVCLNCKHKF